MGLLSRVERIRLEELLLEMPWAANPATRQALVDDQPPAILYNMRFPGDRFGDINEIIQKTDADGARLADGTWPITWVIESAIRRSRELKGVTDLQALLYGIQARIALEDAGVKPESVVNAAAGFADPWAWPTRIEAAMRAVCQVRAGKIGTGFLVAPDLVMTNYHVIDSVLGRPDALRGVELRFDYRRDSRGQLLSQGISYRLAPDRQIVHSPEADLDVALLPVEGRPGERPIGEVTGQPVRGWLLPERQSPKTGQLLFIVQHPGANESLKIAADFVQEVGVKRFTYRTNTGGGSSGAPCFNDRWELVALHRAGHDAPNPTFNQGVPFTAILERPELKRALGV